MDDIPEEVWAEHIYTHLTEWEIGNMGLINNFFNIMSNHELVWVYRMKSYNAECLKNLKDFFITMPSKREGFQVITVIRNVIKHCVKHCDTNVSFAAFRGTHLAFKLDIFGIILHKLNEEWIKNMELLKPLYNEFRYDGQYLETKFFVTFFNQDSHTFEKNFQAGSYIDSNKYIKYKFRANLVVNISGTPENCRKNGNSVIRIFYKDKMLAEERATWVDDILTAGLIPHERIDIDKYTFRKDLAPDRFEFTTYFSNGSKWVHQYLNENDVLLEDGVTKYFYGDDYTERHTIRGKRNGYYIRKDNLQTEDGRFLNDEKVGQWTTKYNDGTTVFYKYVNNRRNGNSLIKRLDGSYLISMWVNDIQNGPAVEHNSDGSEIHFTFVNGFREGHATIKKSAYDDSPINVIYQNGVLI